MLLFRTALTQTRRQLAWLPPACLLLATAASGYAREQVTLRNGYDIVCDHRLAEGLKTRLFLDAGSSSYVDVATSEIATTQQLPPLAAVTGEAAPGRAPQTAQKVLPEVLTAPELHQLLQGAGSAHNLDLDLLASVVHAESAGRLHARSRAGAQGLMQLMPGTAAQLGVTDPFVAEQNVGGGTAYLDSLLHRYHDNLAFALAAYNAGPAAVDRWHGIPPYPETRAYVARIIHEFNLRYTARQTGTVKAAKAPIPGQTLKQNHSYFAQQSGSGCCRSLNNGSVSGCEPGYTYCDSALSASTARLARSTMPQP